MANVISEQANENVVKELTALLDQTFRRAKVATPNDDTAYDVVVYGGTPGGIAAAIAAKRDGASVVLLEQTRHVGGLSTSGLNRDEGEHMDRATFGGLYEDFTRRAATGSGTNPDVHGARIWQSRIAEQVFLEMLKAAGVPVRFEQLIDGVCKDKARITELRVRGGRAYQAKIFIDDLAFGPSNFITGHNDGIVQRLVVALFVIMNEAAAR